MDILQMVCDILMPVSELLHWVTKQAAASHMPQLPFQYLCILKGMPGVAYQALSDFVDDSIVSAHVFTLLVIVRSKTLSPCWVFLR